MPAGLIAAGCAGGSPSDIGHAAAHSDVIALVATGTGQFTRDLESAVQARATSVGFTTRSFISADGSVSGEIRQLGEAIEAHPRAIIVEPVSYPPLVPYFRAAHDAQIPIVLLQTAVDRRNPAYVASFVDADAPMRTTAIMAGVADALARRRPSGILMLIDDWPPAGAPQIVKGLSARYPDAAMKTLRMPRDMAEVSAVVRGAKGPLAVVALGQIGTRTLLAALSGTGDRPAAVVVSPNDAAATELLARSLADVAVGPGLCAMANAAVEAAAKAAEHDVAVVRPSVTVTVRTVSAPGRAGATCR